MLLYLIIGYLATIFLEKLRKITINLERNFTAPIFALQRINRLYCAKTYYALLIYYKKIYI